MTRGSARTTVAAFAVLLGAAAAWFALSARPPAPAPPAAVAPGAAPSAAPPASVPAAPLRPVDAVFEDACGGCHTADDLSRRLREAADPDARAREFERFLASHGSTNAADDRQIVEWLRSARVALQHPGDPAEVR